MAAIRVEIRLLASVMVVLALAAAWHASLPWMPLFPLDDAYLVQHNVRALYLGQDTSFGDVSVLDSSTSLAHLLLVSSFAAFMSTAWAAWASAWFAILLLATGCCRLARRESCAYARRRYSRAIGTSRTQRPRDL